jgi:succinate dehydrogenase / fumarate reductase, cytochrome b subunit
VSTLAVSAPSTSKISPQTYFFLKRLHSLTGLVFGGYICVHLLVNATLAEGIRYNGEKSIFQLQVDKIHSLPFLPAIEWSAILLPLLYHAFYGIVIVWAGRPNVPHYSYGKNWAYLLQRVSAIILVLFLAFHVMSMKGWIPGADNSQLLKALRFEPVEVATTTVIRHMQAAWWVGWVVYPIGILAATFHLANGVWAAAVTWGLTVSSKAQKRWGVVSVGLFLFTFGAGLTALIATLRHETVAPKPGSSGVANVALERGGR